MNRASQLWKIPSIMKVLLISMSYKKDRQKWRSFLLYGGLGGIAVILFYVLGYREYLMAGEESMFLYNAHVDIGGYFMDPNPG